MTTPQGELRLAAEFPEADREQWRDAVRAALAKTGTPVTDDEAPEMTLATRTYDGITVRPLYTTSDAPADAGFPGLAPYTRGTRAEGAGETGWDVRGRYLDPDARASNAAVLADLEGGVTSLWLVAGRGGVAVADLATVLDGVLLDLVPVVLDAGAEDREAAEVLLRIAADRGVPASELRGTLGADPIGWRAATGDRREPADAAELAGRCAREYPGLRAIAVDALPYHRAGGSDAQELGTSMAVGVAYLRALTDHGLPVADAVAQLEFRYAATADQFLTMAKFRAARRLWARVTQACGGVAPQRQHAVTSPAMMTGRDPWVNMLRATVASFGAGVGGADAVSVLPFDDALGLPDDFSRRIARNTSAILIEETKLTRVTDPGGGSSYIERLTDDVARAAWDWFTEIERAGGIVAALDSGIVADRLATTWRQRRERLARRADPLTGVSEFPNLAESLPRRPAAPPQRSGGLPVVRYAQDFERLRERADAHLAAKGTRPTVFLVTLGPVAAHSARAAFATNLFRAGGIDVVDPGEVTDMAGAFASSGAEVCCVCGTERDYGERAAEVATGLKARGARRVLLAGAPRDGLADVDSFVHTGCDAVAVLAETLATMGVS